MYFHYLSLWSAFYFYAQLFSSSISGSCCVHLCLSCSNAVWNTTTVCQYNLIKRRATLADCTLKFKECINMRMNRLMYATVAFTGREECFLAFIIHSSQNCTICTRSGTYSPWKSKSHKAAKWNHSRRLVLHGEILTLYTLLLQFKIWKFTCTAYTASNLSIN